MMADDNETGFAGGSLNASSYNYLPVNEDAVRIAVPVVFGFIFIVGLMGNGLVIGAVLRYKSMWNAPNMFIVNLAVGDVMLILISVPTSATLYTFDNWMYGAVMCKVTYFIRTLSLGVSIFTLTMLSVDRVLVISQPMKLRQKSSVRVGIMVMAIWIFAFLLAIPDAVTYHLSTVTYPSDNSTVSFCNPYLSEWNQDFSYNKLHSTLQTVFFFFLPLAILIVCYGVMAYIMVRSLQGIPGEAPQCLLQRKESINQRKKLAKVVVTLVILFFLCWLPRTIFVLLTFHGKAGKEMTVFHYVFRIVAYCLMFLNSCVNPIALYFLSKSFRKHYWQQLCCLNGMKPLSETELSTKHSNTGGSKVSMKLTRSRNRRHYKPDQPNGSVTELAQLEP
ncbi:gastrin-releasing peptide receptor-like [Watersipora subatra]|uniref:gastrin-releasing peptide receptor-like n=1 Tax=Watersipora subatra TaxID=2589382 RepID=UPI00355BAC05